MAGRAPNRQRMGLNHPATIDIVAEDPGHKEVVLALIHEGAWVGDRSQLLKLQEKLNNYLKFALDGPMFEAYPGTAGNAVVVRVYCWELPDAATAAFLDGATAAAAAAGVRVEVRVLGIGEVIPPLSPI